MFLGDREGLKGLSVLVCVGQLSLKGNGMYGSHDSQVVKRGLRLNLKLGDCVDLERVTVQSGLNVDMLCELEREATEAF